MRSKSIFLSIALVALFSSCSSSKEETPTPPQPQMVEAQIIAQSPADILSRVAVDGEGHVKWQAGDQMQVFVASAGSLSQTPLRFATSEADASKGIFKDTNSSPLKLDATKMYDWWAAIPYVGSQIMSPDGKGFFTLEDQIQGKVPTAHLSQNLLATATAKSVKGDTATRLMFKHQMALMKFVIVNDESQAVEVKGLRIENSTASLGGVLAVDYTKQSEIIAAGSKTLQLTLKPSQTLTSNQQTNAYLVVVPNTVAQQGQFSITILTEEGNLTQTMTMTDAAMTFEAGKMYTTTLHVKGKQITSTIVDWKDAPIIDGTLTPQK